LHIFTDGSKAPGSGRCSAAFYVPVFLYSQSKRLTDFTSSYRAELAAIALALDWVQSVEVYVGVVIFSDSLSSLMALQNNTISESFVLEILSTLTKLNRTGKDISFEWIPSHCGINGNEMVDYYAKMALNKKLKYVMVFLFQNVKHF